MCHRMCQKKQDAGDSLSLAVNPGLQNRPRALYSSSSSSLSISVRSAKQCVNFFTALKLFRVISRVIAWYISLSGLSWIWQSGCSSCGEPRSSESRSDSRPSFAEPRERGSLTPPLQNRFAIPDSGQVDFSLFSVRNLLGRNP